MAENRQKFLKKLNNLYKQMKHWDIQSNRKNFYKKFSVLIRNWQGSLPNLREMLGSTEIDWILKEELKKLKDSDGETFPILEFVASTGYQDEPEMDALGKIILTKVTPVHLAGESKFSTVLPLLFKIYNSGMANYHDESGYSHLHVACQYGFHEVVMKFILGGQDPDGRCYNLGTESQQFPYSPLHLCLRNESYREAELIIWAGADPNLSDVDDWTPLQLMCRFGHNDQLIKFLFEVSEASHRVIQAIDTPDQLGLTPLQLAVSKIMPNAVDVLLNRGADTSGIIFPSEDDFEIFIKKHNSKEELDEKLYLASCTLALIEILSSKGIEVCKDDVVAIMHIFDKYDIFEKSENLQKCHEYTLLDGFADYAGTLKILPHISFYQILCMEPKTVESTFSHREYLKFAESPLRWALSEFYFNAAVMQLNELMWNKRCRRWAKEYFNNKNSEKETTYELCKFMAAGQLSVY